MAGTGTDSVSADSDPRILTVLQWQDVAGYYSNWSATVDAISKLSGIDLVGFATHWNALIHDSSGDYQPEMQARIVNFLASPPQLTAINRAVQAKIARDGWNQVFPPPILNRQQLLVLIRLALQHARWDQSAQDFTGPQVLELLLKLNDHFDDVTPQRPETASPSIYDRIVAFPLMFILNDLHHTRSVEGGVARTLTMLREIQPGVLASSRSRDNALDIAALFAHGSGMTLESFLSLTFATAALATPPGRPESLHRGLAEPNDRGIFNIVPRQFLGGGAAVSATDVASFLSLIARTPADFRELLGGSGTMPEQTNFSVLKKFPLVQFPGSVYRVLDRSFLLDKIGDGAYWLLRDVVERPHSPGTPRAKAVQRLQGWWGMVFEKYVHALVERSPIGPRYTPNPRFADDANEEATDGLVDYGSAVLLLEYKSALVALEPRTGVHARRLAREILRKFAGGRATAASKPLGVAQLARAIRGFLSGRLLNGVSLDRVESIYPVLVCADVAMAAPMVNCLLERRFRRELGQVSGATVGPLTVLSIEDLELALAYEEQMPLVEILRRIHTAEPGLLMHPGHVLRASVLPGVAAGSTWVTKVAADWRREMLTTMWPNGITAKEPPR